MAFIHKTDIKFPKNEAVTVNKKLYKPDYLIQFPISNDTLNLLNCTCVFSIHDRSNAYFRKYVGAEYFEELNSENVSKHINGYLPETVFCFTDNSFPLDDFLKENSFKQFGE